MNTSQMSDRLKQAGWHNLYQQHNGWHRTLQWPYRQFFTLHGAYEIQFPS